jgi:hypothetical protein
VGVGAIGGVVELLGVDGKTPLGGDTGAEGLGVAEDEDTGVVDLGLCITETWSETCASDRCRTLRTDKGGVVKVSLGTDLEADGGRGGLGVVDSLT